MTAHDLFSTKGIVFAGSANTTRKLSPFGSLPSCVYVAESFKNFHVLDSQLKQSL